MREHSHYGVDWIKIYETEDYEGGGYPDPPGAGAFTPDGKMINVPSLTLEENQAIVDEAHRRGLKVACHAYGGEGLRNCLEAGVDMPMHVIVGVTGAEGLDDETIRLFKQPLADGTMRPVMQTLWDLIGDLEDNDLKASRRQDHALRADRDKLQAAGGGGRQGSVSAAALIRWAWRAGLPVRLLREVGHDTGAGLRMATSNAAESLNFDLGKQVGYRRKGQVRRPRRRLGRSFAGHHRDGAREVRDEGRRGVSKRFEVAEMRQ